MKKILKSYELAEKIEIYEKMNDILFIVTF